MGAKSKSTPPKKPAHRPSKFTDLIAHRIISLSEQGKSIRFISKQIGVSERTLMYWLSNKEDLLQLVRGARDLATDMVEAALFQRAVGYSHKAVKISVTDSHGVVEVPYTEHYPPSESAAMFWLKNRRPKKWKDKTEVVSENTNKQHIVYETEWGGSEEPSDGNAATSRKDT